MQNIKIYDKHQEWQEDGVTSNCMILGVHSYAHHLTEYVHKKNLKIFIKGNTQQVIQNILWNEYFSYTLLKDIDKTIFGITQRKNIYLRIDGKALKLSQFLEWSNHQKIQAQIKRCPNFYIQGFMPDSSIKVCSVEIGQYLNGGQYDIVFQYNNLKQRSFSLNWTNGNRSQTNYSYSKTHVKKKQQQGNIPVKSFFETQQPRQRKQNYSIKYKTQKKNKQTKPICNKNQMIKSKQPLKKANSISNKTHKQTSVTSIKTSQNYNRTDALIRLNKIGKQQLTSHILHKKQQRIKQYKKQLQQKQKNYQQKIIKMQQIHEQQVETIKNQVKDVLICYKKKNKALKKQNICLIQMNDKLIKTNKRLQQTIQKMNQNMQILKQGQTNLQKNNLEYSIKMSNIENANTTLINKINTQQLNYQSKLAEKEKFNTQIKTKYERLLGSIKYATADLDKQNIL